MTVGDYNTDGAPDLYITNFGTNVLYRNNGDGTFADTTIETGTGANGGVGAGACFLDMDADGDLDLYAAKYLEFDAAANVTRTINGVPAYASPEKYQPLPDVLFRNESDGTFRDVSIASGIAAYRSWGMGVVAADYDADGDTDIYVSNDVRESYLFENDGAGIFNEVGLRAGLAYDAFGNAQGSMGVDCGDYNNDGKLDFLQSSFQLQHAVLYENQGQGFFEDVAHAAGIAADTFAQVTWGVGLVDFDCDGHRDIFVACGHLQDNVELYDANVTYKARNLLFMSRGNGTFVNQTDHAGSGMQLAFSSRGCAFGDLDNDGDVDCVITNARERPSILENEGDTNRHWIEFSLVGCRANRDGVGTKVRVTTQTLAQTAEVHSGRGYQSHFGSRLHFGISEHTVVDQLEVRWVGGGVDAFKEIPSNRRYLVIENQGIIAVGD
ncbi:MAG: CRTAC1 family protein [Planctomycetia bacterium]|nr:CRTAC1 family protein [Planctomycetia bacterium]